MEGIFALIDERISKYLSNSPYIVALPCVVKKLRDNGLVEVELVSSKARYTVPNWSGSNVEVGENVQLFYKGNILSNQTAYIGASANKGSLNLGSVVEKVNEVSLSNDEAVLGKLIVTNYMETITVNINLTFQGDESNSGNGLITVYVDDVSESYAPQFSIEAQEYKTVSFSFPLNIPIGVHNIEIKGTGEYADLIDGRVCAFGNIDDYESTNGEDYTYTISNGVITIDKYVGNSLCPRIPEKIENISVTKIGSEAFTGTLIERAYIPEGVVEIE